MSMFGVNSGMTRKNEQRSCLADRLSLKNMVNKNHIIGNHMGSSIISKYEGIPTIIGVN